MPRELPEPARLRKLFDYDPTTGILMWRERPREHFKNEQAWRAWNTKYANAEAGCDKGDGYRVIGIDDRTYLAHRIAWAIRHGKWPDQDIDHVDGNPSNNRISNLRNVDHQTNLRNAKMRADNTSGINGVHWHKQAGKWQARVKVAGRTKSLGLFDNLADAAAARKAADRKYGFSARHGESA